MRNPEHRYDLGNLRKILEDDYKDVQFSAVDQKDQSRLSFYFTKIINKWSVLRADDIVDILDEYIEESDNEPNVEVVRLLKLKLKSSGIDRDDFLRFVQKFVEQKYPIDVFYKKYYDTRRVVPSLTDLFGDELEDLSSSSDDDTPPVDGDDPVDTVPQPVRKRMTIHLSDASPPKGGADKKYQTMRDVNNQDCEFLYKKIPWVKDVVNSIYVHPIKGDFYGVVDPERFIVHDEDHYYQPLEKYYYLQCRSSKSQQGTLLTVKKDGQTYKMMVALDTAAKGVVLQNEDMLKAEIDYLLNWNDSKRAYLKTSKRDPPTDEMILLAKYNLLYSLQSAMKDSLPSAYRSIDAPFIGDVIGSMLKHSTSGLEFVRLLINVTVFLEINLSFVSCSVFVKRLREQIYLPGTVPLLTDADKLPEIFLNSNVPEDTRKFVLEKLESKRVELTDDFFVNLHLNVSMTTRKQSRPVLWNKPVQQIELPNVKTVCKNKKDVEHEKDENLLFYADSGDVYCFNVYDLYDRFGRNEMSNPYTGQPFSADFVRSCLSLYATTKPESRSNDESSFDLIDELEAMIDAQLTLLENRLIETFIPAPSQSKDENRAPSVDQKTTDKVVETHKKCAECKIVVPDDSADSVTTFFRNKEVVFCGYECLEKNKNFK